MSFSARLSGDYTIELRINGYRIGGGLVTRTFRPGKKYEKEEEHLTLNRPVEPKLLSRTTK